MSDEHCSWWIRWYHRRLREADRRFMIPLLLGQVAEDDTDRRIKLFALFSTDRGQEHWQCPCGIPDRDALVRML